MECILWQGRWKSNQYPDGAVHGVAYVLMPALLDSQHLHEYSTDLIIQYDGAFRGGERHVFHVTVKYNSESKTFKITSNGSVQQLIFETTVPLKDNPDAIPGKYVSVYPFDQGIFALEHSKLEKIPIASVKKPQCIIM